MLVSMHWKVIINSRLKIQVVTRNRLTQCKQSPRRADPLYGRLVSFTNQQDLEMYGRIIFYALIINKFVETLVNCRMFKHVLIIDYVGLLFLFIHQIQAIIKIDNFALQVPSPCHVLLAKYSLKQGQATLGTGANIGTLEGDHWHTDMSEFLLKIKSVFKKYSALNPLTFVQITILHIILHSL